MTAISIEKLKGDLQNFSEETLENEYQRLVALGHKDLAIQVDGLIAEKRLQNFLESGAEELSEQLIYDSFKKMSNVISYVLTA